MPGDWDGNTYTVKAIGAGGNAYNAEDGPATGGGGGASAPTGQVFNGSSAFVVSKAGQSGASTFIFAGGSAVIETGAVLTGGSDVFSGGFLLRGGDALRAIQRKEGIHAFHWAQPLEAGNCKDQGGQHNDAHPQRGPAPPEADLHIGLPRKPYHPRQRRRQQQQVIGMGELEVHLRMSFCTRWFWESAT